LLRKPKPKPKQKQKVIVTFTLTFKTVNSKLVIVHVDVNYILFAKDGKIWLNQQQMAELFATSKQLISYHIINILKEKELEEISVVKQYLTTAADGKNYNVVFYSLEEIQ